MNQSNVLTKPKVGAAFERDARILMGKQYILYKDQKVSQLADKNYRTGNINTLPFEGVC